jgi:hypothetical protein
MRKRFMTRQPELSTETRGEESPFVTEFFLVQCAGLRCTAYRDHDGRWRGAFDHVELPGLVRVLA